MVKLAKILGWMAGGLVVLAAVVTGVGLSYRVYRQHQLAPDLSIATPNGIDEHMLVPAGGIRQYVTIRGQDRRNPILLFVHGGPAEAHSYFPEIYQSWEKDFTVVQWDQRGAGRTYGANPKPPADLNLVHIVDDGIEITEWLTKHLGQRKVILVGHSWGTIVGEHMVFKHPDLFSAYVGTGQVVSWNATLAAQYAYSVAHAKEIGDNAMLKTLAEIGPPPFKDLPTYFRFQRTTRPYLAESDAAFISGMADRVLYAPRTAPWDVLSFNNAALPSLMALGPDVAAADLPALGLDFPIPFFVIQGADDHITPTAVSKDYFDHIRAPKKAFFVIENAGHFVAMTRPSEFLRTLDEAVRPLMTDAKQSDSRARP